MEAIWFLTGASALAAAALAAKVILDGIRGPPARWGCESYGERSRRLHLERKG